MRGAALVLIDVVNAFDFPGSRQLARAAGVAARSIERLAARAREEDVPLIYVNDNFGRWRSDFNDTVRECTKPEHLGSGVSERLRPRQGDYFVLKPQHSGFYQTPLEQLLDHLRVHTLILVGFATNICVLFTANDAHMRGFHLVIPSDCCAANSAALHRGCLQQLRAALHVKTPLSRSVNFAACSRGQRRPSGQAFHS